ncbi:hypothetical protein EMCRGX_G035042 [Ephydatia muelleri]
MGPRWHHHIALDGKESPLSLWDSAIAEWSTGHNESPPSGPMSHREKLWDLPRVSSIAAELLATAPDPLSKARLLSASKKESASEVCAAANQAEQTKIKKYSYITSHAYHSFTPVAFETTGVCGPRSMSFLTDLGRRIVNTTGEKSSLAYLLQKFSVAIQRGNAASVLGTLPPTLSPPLNNGV